MRMMRDFWDGESGISCPGRRFPSPVHPFCLTEAFICEEKIGNLLAGPWSSWL